MVRQERKACLICTDRKRDLHIEMMNSQLIKGIFFLELLIIAQKAASCSNQLLEEEWFLQILTWKVLLMAL